MSEFAAYIGLPWEAGAQGPAAYDCMAFFRHVQRQHFGIDVPEIIAPDYDDSTALVALFAAHEERHRWSEIAAPEHGCAVLIRKPLHIGVWLAVDGGGVLHCQRGAGVVFTKDSAWACSGLGRKQFYRFAA